MSAPTAVIRCVPVPFALQVARQTLSILSSYYPETLSLSVLLNMPWIVRTFINLIWPFVDPVTKQKVKFGTNIVQDGEVDASQLLQKCGGGLMVGFQSIG